MEPFTLRPEYPFFRLSNTQDMLLFLIRQELVGTRFIQSLADIGFDTSVYSPDLGVLILTMLGYQQRPDALWTWYLDTIEHFAAQVKLGTNEGLEELVLGCYTKLKAGGQ